MLSVRGLTGLILSATTKPEAFHWDRPVPTAAAGTRMCHCVQTQETGRLWSHSSAAAAELPLELSGQFLGTAKRSCLMPSQL